MTWENLTERLIALGIAGFLYFDTNRLIREAFGEAGYPAPGQRMRVVQG
jgi:hypothetical protein